VSDADEMGKRNLERIGPEVWRIDRNLKGISARKNLYIGILFLREFDTNRIMHGLIFII
jgi:hypothetical protein